MKQQQQQQQKINVQIDIDIYRNYPEINMNNCFVNLIPVCAKFVFAYLSTRLVFPPKWFLLVL